MSLKMIYVSWSQFSKALKSSKGFSLIELVITLGIALVVASGSAYVMNSALQQNQKLQSGLEFERLNRQIREINFRANQTCSSIFSFPSAFPVNNPGPVSVPIRIQFAPNITLETNTKLLQYNLELVSVEFARAISKGTDAAGNHFYQGLIEIEGRPVTAGALAKAFAIN